MGASDTHNAGRKLSSRRRMAYRHDVAASRHAHDSLLSACRRRAHWNKAQRRPPTFYVHDPANPVATIGGRRGNDCIQDQRPLQSRVDILTFLSAPLTSQLDLTGSPGAFLSTSSDAPEADFIVDFAQPGPSGEGLQRRVARAGQRYPEHAAAIVSQVVGIPMRIGLCVWAVLSGYRRIN
jgi:predicted acyl esterase